MNSNYLKIKVPFATTGYINSRADALSLCGEVIYLYNKTLCKVVSEATILFHANFKKTNYQMVYKEKIRKNRKKSIGTDNYWKNKKIRDEYLDKFSLPNHKLKETSFYEMSKTQINEINKVTFDLRMTSRSVYGLLSGANVSGAEKKPGATPLKCTEASFFACNFANPFKKILRKEKEINIYKISCDEILFGEFVDNEISQEFNLEFFKFNKYLKFGGMINYINSYEEISTAIINNLKHENKIETSVNSSIKIKKTKQKIHTKNDVFEPNEDQKDFITSIKNNNFKWGKNEINRRLRQYFTSNVDEYIKHEIIPLYSTKEKFDKVLIQNAHIVSFSNCVKENNYLLSINPYNCLRIDANAHILYDRGGYIFNKNGDLIHRIKNKCIQKNFLDINILPIETKNILFNSVQNKTL